MVQQVFDIALIVKDLLFDNWDLADELDKAKFKWNSFEPSRIEVRELPLSIYVSYQTGTGTPTSKAVSQMADQLKIDVFISIKNLEDEKERLAKEGNRMRIKDEILRIIHDNQTAIQRIKFGKYTRTVRSDELINNQDSGKDQKWFLHEMLFMQAEWYHVQS